MRGRRKRGRMLRWSRLVMAAGPKLIALPVDSTWTRRSLANGSRARLPTPAEPERVAPVSASRSGPVPPGEVHQNGTGNSAVFCWHDSAAARPQFQAQRAARFRFVCTAAAAAPTFGPDRRSVYQ